MTKIKICGLSRERDIEAVNRCRPDYVGFVMAESRRRVSAEMAERLKARLDPGIKAVGVFVNEDISLITDLYTAGIIDTVQLHGDEDAGYIGTLKRAIPASVIKAIRVHSRQQIYEAQGIPADLMLFDTYNQGTYGGSGQSFDWSLIPVLSKGFFLAGGLNINNIGAAIQAVSPWAVDISSGVETNGLKDEDKIRAIIAMIRAADKTYYRGRTNSI